MQTSLGSWNEDPRIHRMIMTMLLCVALFALLWGLQSLSRPIIGSPHYTIDDGPGTRGTLPLSFPSSGKNIIIELPIFLSPLTPRSLSIRPDDCLDAVTINGNAVTAATLPFCDYVHGKVVDLRAYLRAGENTLTLTIRDHGGMGGVDIHAPYKHPLFLALTAGWIAVLTLFAWTLFRFLPLPPHLRSLTTVFTTGLILRLFYLLHTPYTLRGHDADGHLEYVQHLLTHWSLPDPHAGWEFYQPPLYYILGAGWVAAAQLLGSLSHPAILLQFLAFLCTTAALGIGMAIGTRLFHTNTDRVLFGILLTTFPASIFFAARINNDVLFLLLGTVSIALILQWWENARTKTWYLFVATLGLLLLTKLNAILLLPILLLPYLRTRRWHLERTAASLFLLFAIAGWFFVPRAMTEDRPGTIVVGNIGNLNSGLHVPNTIASLTIFSPLKVLWHPFNNAWNDVERRQYFWEYFFRSAFFGEFGHNPSLRPLAIMILTMALIFIPITFFGLWSSLRSHSPGASPLFHLLWTGLLGSLAYRILYPYASSQDFRYAILLTIPVTFFLVHGIAALPKPLHRLVHCATFVFAGLCAAFIVAISIV